MTTPAPTGATEEAATATPTGMIESSTAGADQCPDRRPRRPGRAQRRRLARLVVVLAALVTGVAAVVVAAWVPGAPVDSTTSTVTWPRQGQAPAPTTLFLVPYRPASLAATVPCAAIRAARARSAPTTVLATVTGAPADGLVVRTRPASSSSPAAVEVIVDGRLVPVDVPDEDCDLQVRADAEGLAVSLGDEARPVATVPADPVPEVFAATTDLAGGDARGLALSARTPSWFDNAPTPAKDGLIATQYQLATVAVLLVLLAGLLTPTDPAGRGLRELRSGRGSRSPARGGGG